MDEKRRLREWAQQLMAPTGEECAAVVGALTRHLSGIEPTAVLVYLSMQGELPAEAVVDLLGSRHRWLTTRTPEKGWLTVHPYEARRELHRFGYSQPVSDAPTVEAAEIGVAIVPGLCFDRHGSRLGWGKGYYDELLARTSPTTVRIGVTLERRLAASIPTEDHDVRMTHLVTELGVRPVTGTDAV
jgi:5-formyltetrahydrofolate cyclo-ligase